MIMYMLQLTNVPYMLHALFCVFYAVPSQTSVMHIMCADGVQTYGRMLQNHSSVSYSRINQLYSFVSATFGDIMADVLLAGMSGKESRNHELIQQVNVTGTKV